MYPSVLTSKLLTDLSKIRLTLCKQICSVVFPATGPDFGGKLRSSKVYMGNLNSFMKILSSALYFLLDEGVIVPSLDASAGDLRSLSYCAGPELSGVSSVCPGLCSLSKSYHAIWGNTVFQYHSWSGGLDIFSLFWECLTVASRLFVDHTLQMLKSDQACDNVGQVM